MAFTGLSGFVAELERQGELVRINTAVDPSLEITEITDRIFKSGGKALLFENNGTQFPVLINIFGSDRRLEIALGNQPEKMATEIETIFNSLSKGIKGVKYLPKLLNCLPKKSLFRGRCQQVIHEDPNLSMLPVLKCWSHDGGPFFTLPIVHTIHPITKKANAGMYRMQVLDNKTTAMHWQRHKTGANHFEAWKQGGEKMPVSVVLGGDPVYTYAATAPLPENIDEYLLAGFLGGKRVKMVKCITNNLYVPDDADIVLEGFVDPKEEMVWEGPFGDHTGFYSLADWYPRFHVTCITCSKNAIYPATIVGVPPMEDSFIAKATEKLFLSPLKLVIQPEIVDMHLPDAGVAHNLAIVKIKKSYPGQGKKVLYAIFGAGQMSFSKFLVVVDGDVDIRNYPVLVDNVFCNTVFNRDLLFTNGPLDVLDHASDYQAFGGKLGIDATVKMEGEGRSETNGNEVLGIGLLSMKIQELLGPDVNVTTLESTPIMLLTVPRDCGEEKKREIKDKLATCGILGETRLVLLTETGLPSGEIDILAWYLLANCDPVRDCLIIDNNTLVIDGTVKALKKGFSRKWPNVVISSSETINKVDNKWVDLKLGDFIQSPSLKYRGILGEGTDYLLFDGQ